MQVEQAELSCVAVLTPRRFGAARGWFCETWKSAALCPAGLDWPDLVKYTLCKRRPNYTLCGLHYQCAPRAQDKLIWCSRGMILDVAVDFRVGSASFGRHVAVELSSESGAQLFLPKGFLHGFLTLTSDCEVQYKCTDVYAPECDGAVAWNSVGIDWGTDAPVLSPKDASAVRFADFVTPFIPEGEV